MKLKLLFLSTLLFCFTSTFSQEKDERSYILKLNATSLVDGFSFPTVQLALERKFNNSFSVQGEFGLQLYELGQSVDTVSLDAKGFRAMAEGRFYFLNYYKKIKTRKEYLMVFMLEYNYFIVKTNLAEIQATILKIAKMKNCTKTILVSKKIFWEPI